MPTFNENSEMPHLIGIALATLLAIAAILSAAGGDTVRAKAPLGRAVAEETSSHVF